MRKPNIKINGEALDTDIRKAEGNRYNQSNISTIIMGRAKSYYAQCICKNSMEENVLDKLCTFYDLDKIDYVITEEAEKAAIIKQVDNLNYENILTLLASIDKSLREILAQEKSNQFTLGEIQNAILTGNGHSKASLEILQTQEKRKQNYHNTTNKLRSVN